MTWSRKKISHFLSLAGAWLTRARTNAIDAGDKELTLAIDGAMKSVSEVQALIAREPRSPVHA